jgi:hypothetical protein
MRRGMQIVMRDMRHAALEWHMNRRNRREGTVDIHQMIRAQARGLWLEDTQLHVTYCSYM